MMSSAFFEPLPGRHIVSNGNRLFVSEMGSGPPVLLIHGLGWSHSLWHQVMYRLSGSYHVIAADTRGHGASEKPPGPYSMNQLTDDWQGILDAFNISRCAIIGLSQGGMIAMQLACRHPQRVSALGLLGTSSYFTDTAWMGMQERGKVLREMGARAAAEHTSRSVFSPKFAASNPVMIEDFVENRLAASGAALAAATASLEGFDIRGELSHVTCPVLVMHGSADSVISPGSAMETVRALPQAETVIVPDAGHILPVECPELVGRHLALFLEANYASYVLD